MTYTTRQILLLAACGLFFGCERLPTQVGNVQRVAPAFTAAVSPPAERTIYENLYDMTDSHFLFRCTPDGAVGEDTEGELVRLEGQIYERFTLVADAAGGYHGRWHAMPVGLRGFGVDTGEEFRISVQNQGGGNQTMNGTSGAYRQTLRLVGKDTGRSFTAVYSGHYRVTWDEDEQVEKVIVQRNLERLECRL